MVYDAGRPTGDRGRTIVVVGDPPTPLEPGREYTLTCTEYMAKDLARLGLAVERLATTEDLLLEHLSAPGTRSARLDGRLVQHGQLTTRPAFSTWAQVVGCASRRTPRPQMG